MFFSRVDFRSEGYYGCLTGVGSAESNTDVCVNMFSREKKLDIVSMPLSKLSLESKSRNHSKEREKEDSEGNAVRI